MCEDHVGLRDQLLRALLHLGACGRKAIIDANIAALPPTEPSRACWNFVNRASVSGSSSAKMEDVPAVYTRALCAD